MKINWISRACSLEFQYCVCVLLAVSLQPMDRIQLATLIFFVFVLYEDEVLDKNLGLFEPFFRFFPFIEYLTITKSFVTICISKVTSRPLIWQPSECNFVNIKWRYGILGFFRFRVSNVFSKTNTEKKSYTLILLNVNCWINFRLNHWINHTVE